MNTKKLALLAQVLVLPVVLAHSPANAAPWANPTGTNERFEWSAGQNTNDMLGDPVNIAQGLFFTGMTGFRAEGGGGVGDSIVDLASAVVNTASVGADPLNHYNVREWGTWNIGGPQGAVNPEDVFAVQADVSVLRIQPEFWLTQADITDMSLVFFPDGTWVTEGSILSPAEPGEWIEGLFKASSSLQVDGAAPAGTWIQLDGVQMTLPEPGSMSLILLGGSLVLLRRRS